VTSPTKKLFRGGVQPINADTEAEHRKKGKSLCSFSFTTQTDTDGHDLGGEVRGESWGHIYWVADKFKNSQRSPNKMDEPVLILLKEHAIQCEAGHQIYTEGKPKKLQLLTAKVIIWNFPEPSGVTITSKKVHLARGGKGELHEEDRGRKRAYSAF